MEGRTASLRAVVLAAVLPVAMGGWEKKLNGMYCTQATYFGYACTHYGCSGDVGYNGVGTTPYDCFVHCNTYGHTEPIISFGSSNGDCRCANPNSCATTGTQGSTHFQSNSFWHTYQCEFGVPHARSSSCAPAKISVKNQPRA